MKICSVNLDRETTFLTLIECGFQMPKTVCQSVAWFKRYKTLKSVTVGRVAQLEKILIFSENSLGLRPRS